MEPGEALSTAAQIAVTLAGFAGVVVVFQRESVARVVANRQVPAPVTTDQFNPFTHVLHDRVAVAGD
jgi:hypothetical protein